MNTEQQPRRPNGIGKKPPTYNDPARRWLMQLSKAALADCVIDLLRGQSDSLDEPVSEEAARERLGAVLTMRGDKEPKLSRADIETRMRKP